MKKRAASPAPSENEVDIAGSLFANDFDSDSDSDSDDGVQNKNDSASKQPADLDFGDLLNAGGEGGLENGGSDDDEDFITQQQRSSNRKAPVSQTKSSKKGGGFQSMGQSACHHTRYSHCSHHA